MAKKWSTEGSMALQEKRCRVITIEAAESPQNIKLRVAAYARVSSASDDQLNSFAAQSRYYISLISGKENWSMVDIYADNGIRDFCRKTRGLPAAPGRLPKRIDRQSVGEVHLPLCTQHQGMPGGHPGAESIGDRDLLRKRKH